MRMYVSDGHRFEEVNLTCEERKLEVVEEIVKRIPELVGVGERVIEASIRVITVDESGVKREYFVEV